MTEPLVIHTDEDHRQAQMRIAELNGEPDTDAKAEELQALADAILVFQLRLNET